ncbi:MAG: zinc metallopeptidase [Planctomycetota bacterium]
MGLGYIVVMVLTMGLSWLTSMWVKSAFAKYSKVQAQNGMTGAEIARAILSWNQVTEVQVEETPGKLSDHYDPRAKRLRLSSDNYHGRSIAALGIAAHEVGHAIQHAEGYMWLGFRSAIVPLLGVSSRFSWILIMIGFALGAATQSGLGFYAAMAGVAMFAVTTAFTLVTLPVEFDASNRAMRALKEGQILNPDELSGARAVLRAAASTYLAAAIGSIMQLLYWLWRLGLIGGRRR